MNKIIYDTAFQIVATQETMCRNLENVGLRFEYGDGVVGEALLNLINDSETIIKAALGLHVISKNGKCRIGAVDYPVTIDILYTAENDPAWSITEDDFCEFFYNAVKNENVRNLMWEAMVNHNQTAKDEYNKLDFGCIGCVE